MYSKKAITQLFSWMSKTNVYVHVNMMHELHYSITNDTPETTRICKSLSNRNNDSVHYIGFMKIATYIGDNSCKYRVVPQLKRGSI